MQKWAIYCTEVDPRKFKETVAEVLTTILIWSLEMEKEWHE